MFKKKIQKLLNNILFFGRSKKKENRNQGNGTSKKNIVNMYDNLKIYIKTKNIQHNTILEIIWTVIPILVLVFIAVPSLNLLYFIENPVAFDLNSISCSIVVIGHQWYWSYEFVNVITSDILNSVSVDLLKTEHKEFDSYLVNTDDILLTKGLRLLDVDFPLLVPCNIKIYFNITSADVLHSWAIPALGIKMDAVPGRLSLAINTIRLTGIYYGQCSEICGIGHGFMPIKIMVI